MQFVIYACALLGICSASLTNLMSQSRNLYSYSKDGLFFKVFSELDPKTGVPSKGAWIVIIPICIAVFSFDIVQLAQLTSLGNLMTYAFINTAVIALRLQNNNAINPQTAAQKTHNRAKIFLLNWSPWTFMILSFNMVVSINHNYFVKYVFTMLTILNFVVLQVLVMQTAEEQK
jgi:amino acid transporter